MNTYPLSNAQKRIWYAQKKYRDSSLFNIGGIVKINGEIKVSALSQAITQVVKNNLALNLQFKEDSNQVYQYVSQMKCFVDYADFSSYADPLNSFERWYKKQAGIPFVMVDNPLYSFTIYKISKYVTGYFIKLHHIIADGWSIKLLTDQIIKSYEAIIKDELCEDEEIPSYIDYVIEEEKLINSDNVIKIKDYWIHMFTPLPELSTLPHNELNGQRTSFVIDISLFNKIDNYIKEHGLTINTFFLGIYLLYEYKKYGKKDIILGIPLLGRRGKKERHIFGTFTNTMPYRYVINNNELISEMMEEVSADLKKCYSNQKYPYNLLVDELKLHENGVDRLYNVCINYYNTIINTNINGFPIENTEFYNGQQDYALQVILRHWDGIKLQLDFDFQTAVYSEKQIDEMYKQLMILLEQIIKDDSMKVRDLILLTEDEKHKVIYDFNNTKTYYPSNKTWIDLFEDIAISSPNKIAVSKNLEYLTYQELNYKANSLAHYLKTIGVQTNTIVGALIEHNIDSIVSIMAIMKCGGIYLPLDVNNPISRANNILTSSGAKYLIVNEQSLLDFNGIIISLKKINAINNEPNKINLCNPSNTAYMIFTSGSTGIPKGVMVSHKNLMNYLCWAKKTYIKHEKEVFALYSTFAFDFTMTSIFLPLLCGGEIRIYDNARDENVFHKIMYDNKATIVKITPSHIPLINDLVIHNSSIHTFVIGGENLKIQACRRLYEHFNKSVDIYNEYGPTEATVGCMIYLYDYEKANIDYVPIGRPIDNTQIYLLGDELLPVPDNTLGELFISGDSLSKGYFNLIDETNKRFIPNPYISDNFMYKTGDKAYRDNDSMVVFYGRGDDEVKIRSNRVSISEIEQKILSSGMADNVVVLTTECDNDSIQLCAYILQNDKYNLEKLKDYLELCLPVYMIPQFYVYMDKFPLTINGKIDRDKLPNPLTCKEDKSVLDKNRSLQLDILITSISSILSNKDISPYDNFYAIGGDSIKAIQISSRLSEKGFELTVRDILTNPVISQMATFVKVRTKQIYEQGICNGEIKYTPIISWFFEQNIKKRGHYNQSVLLELKQNISIDILDKVFYKLINHHDILRLNCSDEDNTLYYNNYHLNNKSIINEIDLSLEENTNLLKLIEKHIRQNFCLNNELLIRPYLIHTANRSLLYINAHHLVIDGVSWRIIFEDIVTLLTQIIEARDVKLPEKTSSFQQFSDGYYKCADKKIDITYWNEILSRNYYEKLITKNQTVPNNDIHTIQIDLDIEMTDKLLGQANESYSTKSNELILIALARSIKQLFNINEMLFEIEAHGRDILEQINLSRTVGWLTNMFPVRIIIDSDDLHTQIQSLKEQIRQTSKKGFEYGILKYINKKILTNSKCFRFNFLGDYQDILNDYLKIDQLFIDNEFYNNETMLLMDTNAVVINKKLLVSFTYYKNLFENDIIDNLTKLFKENLIKVIEFCCSIKERVFTPIDFDMVNLTQAELNSLLDR